MGVCNCSMFCCMLLYVHSSIAIILMGKRELVALLNLSFWCLMMVERLFLAVPWGCLRFVIVVFPDHTHLLFLLYLIIWASLRENLTLLHVNNKGTDQPTHPCSLISVIDIRLLKHIISKLASGNFNKAK